MKRLRASEIAQFEYCQRAWWYAREGHSSANGTWLRAGERWHQSHGRDVLAAGCLRSLGYAMLLGALVGAAVNLTAQILR